MFCKITFGYSHSTCLGADLIGNCCFLYFVLLDMSSYFGLFRVASWVLERVGWESWEIERILIKWLNLSFFISLSLWNKQ